MVQGGRNFSMKAFSEWKKYNMSCFLIRFVHIVEESLEFTVLRLSYLRTSTVFDNPTKQVKIKINCETPIHSLPKISFKLDKEIVKNNKFW